MHIRNITSGYGTIKSLSNKYLISSLEYCNFMGFIPYGCCFTGFELSRSTSLLEYQEISAHIQELTFLGHHVECDLNVIVSCLDPVKWQNSEVLNKWDQIFQSLFLHSMCLHSSFHFVSGTKLITLICVTFKLSLSTVFSTYKYDLIAFASVRMVII